MNACFPSLSRLQAAPSSPSPGGVSLLIGKPTFKLGLALSTSVSTQDMAKYWKSPLLHLAAHGQLFFLCGSPSWSPLVSWSPLPSLPLLSCPLPVHPVSLPAVPRLVLQNRSWWTRSPPPLSSMSTSAWLFSKLPYLTVGSSALLVSMPQLT